MTVLKPTTPSLADYSVPKETEHVFQKGIIENQFITPHLPEGAAEIAKHITFEGNAKPSIPINWRFAESSAALKAYEGTILNVLLKKKYGIEPVPIKINTDHASLFSISPFIWALDPSGDNLSATSFRDPEGAKKVAAYFPDWDKHRAGDDFYRTCATNIYKLKDGRFFHVHADFHLGSLNPDPTLDSLGLPHDMPIDSPEGAFKPYMDAVGKLTGDEMQHLATEVYRQAGTICYTMDEYRNSEHGKANAHVGLFDIHHHPNPHQKGSWWPDSPTTGLSRPLAGLKVVDLTRIIAAPAVSRGLAELGASVMRVVAPHQPDMAMLHADLNHGKWNTLLDLRKEADREKLKDLVLEADVFLQGYRPGVLEKYGFGEKDILDMCQARGRGIIYARENCYGWQGPWSGRTGWQQISDANVGISYEYGRAMGYNEPVTPVFPNSDFCTGIAGLTGIMTALLRRADEGGSYTVDIALNYYSQWLANSCGTYPDEVWQDVWKRHGSPTFRHYHPMQIQLPKILALLKENSAAQLFRPDFFTQYHVGNLGKDMRLLAPVLRFPGGEVKPGFQVGTRGNGVDAPHWPKDLSVEVVN